MSRVIRKPTIVTAGLPYELAKALEPVKQSIEMITGARGGGVDQLHGLSEEASTYEIIAKINEIIARLNSTGTCEVK